MNTAPVVAFVCLHGSAKSLIAAEYLTRVAAARGLNLIGTTSGPEPDGEIPENVVAGLRARNIGVTGTTLVMLSSDRLANAVHIVTFGPDVAGIAPSGVRIDNWDDCPSVSDDFDFAWDFITAHVEKLLTSLAK